VTIKDEMLEKLRARTPLSEIKRDYRSMSGMYEAIREFLLEADKIVENKQRKLLEVERNSSAREAELKKLNHERKQTLKEIVRLKQRKEKLTKETKDTSGELTQLKAEAARLRENGFTPEILKKIKVIEDRSASGLLAQVETAEQYHNIKKEVSNLKELKARLKEEVQTRKARKKAISRKILSEKNRFDELKLRTNTFKEAVAVVSSLFRSGYTTEDLRSLRYGLDMLGINGDLRFSVTRLVKGLKKQKSLVKLEDCLVGKKAELHRFKKAIADVKADLKVTRQIANAFDELKEAGVKAITESTEEAKAGIAYNKTAFESHVKDSIGMLVDKIRVIMEEFRADLGQWGDLQQQIGKLQDLLLPGQVLLGMLQSTNYLEKIPLDLVVQLLERLALWGEINLPDAYTPLSQKIRNKLYDIQILQRCKATVMIEMAYESFREIMIQKKETGN